MLLETTLNYVSRYGYLGIFLALVFGIVGLPIPDETLLTFSGYLIYKGTLRPIPTFGSAWLGAISRITISYLIGRYLGVGFITRYGARFRITPEKMARVHDWFEKRGKWTLTIGYFIPTVRHLFAVVAGSSKLEYRTFALFAYAGGIVWSSLFITLGYFLGEAWRQAVKHIDDASIALLAILVAAGVAYLVVKRLKRKPA